MMIAIRKSDSVTSQVIITRPFFAFQFSHVDQLAGWNPARVAKKRDREVPYGMKGGES
jgi:hypothetical protein